MRKPMLFDSGRHVIEACKKHLTGGTRTSCTWPEYCYFINGQSLDTTISKPDDMIPETLCNCALLGIMVKDMEPLCDEGDFIKLTIEYLEYL